jgi:hypothetical protein
MAKSHFAIERPRKISISIEGYNAEAQTQAQKRKQQERSLRQKRKAETAPKRQRHELGANPPPLRRHRQEEADELEALTRAAACQPLTSEVEKQVRAAFANGEDVHANE